MSDHTSHFSGVRGSIIAACSEMERLLKGLTDSKGRVADEIHQTRKAGKRLRGGLVIAGEPKPCVRWIGVVGRMLGGSRDAAVRVKTWNSLGIDASPVGSSEAAAAALLELEADASTRKPPQAVIDWSLAALCQVRGRLESQTDEEVAEAAEDGARKLEKQLRKRLKRALQRVINEDFHDCRKAVKAWLGGMALAAPDLPLVGKEEAERLANSLGEENDLEVLAAWLEARGFTPTICPCAWKVLRKRQEKVRRKSISVIRKELLPALKRKG
ncbi:CHAD domain-containing protein [Luteolibacter flavescens]|uniref:CHAD domain-containing protein n=1 Tax=Luteolibacter flavescens TaxID=1859460 RepID=A0ABT3FVE9_9BACT|nr:CHAD domain-containing protein [Luteolibacter flavescens]MCW1887392.1 CHAD domain-containing protein [Luteolibacter flavescens]